MAAVFRRVTDEVRAQVEVAAPPEPPELRRLDRRARLVLGLFTHQETATTTDIARALGLSPRTVRDLAAGWLADGWLEVADPARKSRRQVWRRAKPGAKHLIGGISTSYSRFNRNRGNRGKE